MQMHWAKLHQKGMEALDALREGTGDGDRVFVAIDFEDGHETRKNISECGPAIFTPGGPESNARPGSKVETEHYTFRGRRGPKTWRRFRFGEITSVSAMQLRGRILCKLENFSQRFGKMMLVGYSIGFDL